MEFDIVFARLEFGSIRARDSRQQLTAGLAWSLHWQLVISGKGVVKMAKSYSGANKLQSIQNHKIGIKLSLQTLHGILSSSV